MPPPNMPLPLLHSPAQLHIGKPRFVLNGEHLEIHALVDLDGLEQIQAILKKYEEILELMAPEKDDPTGQKEC